MNICFLKYSQCLNNNQLAGIISQVSLAMSFCKAPALRAIKIVKYKQIILRYKRFSL